MSRVISIISNEFITQDEVFDFIKLADGKMSSISNFTQGIIQKGESTIWIYYRGEDNNFDDDELEELKGNFNINPKVSIAVNISSEDGSKELAVNFCAKFLKSYSNCVVDDSYGNFFRIDELNKL